MRKSHDETPEERAARIRANKKRYRERHREELRQKALTDPKAKERRQRYRERHAEKIKERDRAYYVANRDKFREANRAWVAAHPEKQREYQRKYFRENPETCRESGRKYRDANRDKWREKNRKYDAANPHRKVARTAARRARKIQATPKWADLKAIDAIYAEARRLGLSVDHIVPLRGKNVCGLHVPWNLQLLPLIENTRKNNRFDPADLQTYCPP